MHDQTQYLKTPNRKGSPLARQSTRSGNKLTPRSVNKPTPLQIALGQGQPDTSTGSGYD